MIYKMNLSANNGSDAYFMALSTSSVANSTAALLSSKFASSELGGFNVIAFL